jgi:hypothetical protein
MPAYSPLAYVVCFHGNAESLGHSLDTYKILHDLHVFVLAVEYRGFGSCSGSPSEAGIELDIQTLSKYLHGLLPNNGTPVVSMGRSLGGAVACKLASSFPVSGLILESTFSSLLDVSKRSFPFLPVSLLLREKYDSGSIVRNLECPLLMLHSQDDDVVPYDLGQRLFQQAKCEKQFVELVGSHNQGYKESESIRIAAYAQFFELLQQRKSAKP